MSGRVRCLLGQGSGGGGGAVGVIPPVGIGLAGSTMNVRSMLGIHSGGSDLVPSDALAALARHYGRLTLLIAISFFVVDFFPSYLPIFDTRSLFCN